MNREPNRQGGRKAVWWGGGSSGTTQRNANVMRMRRCVGGNGRINARGGGKRFKNAAFEEPTVNRDNMRENTIHNNEL